jgi:hypothetical protein
LFDTERGRRDAVDVTVGRIVRIGLVGIVLLAVILAVAVELWMYRGTSVVGLAPRPATGLQDIQSVSDLQARFDQDAERPRLIILISPT